MHCQVVASAWGHGHDTEDAPQAQAILVLGASVRPDRQPSDMLRDRLVTAAELYKRGCAPKILVSGDHGSPDYDEVGTMARVLEEEGVPPQDIFLDHAGFRTLDSMYRARHVYGLERVLVVSNPFHVSRAVFLGQNFGLETEGVGAAELQPYSLATHLSHQGREVLARIWAWFDVYLWDTRPRKMDPPISLEGDGRRTR